MTEQRIDPRVFDPEANRAWLRKRKGLGASDVPALTGLDKFRDRQQTYDRLVALHDHGVILEEEIGPDQARGMLLEHVAAELYEEQTQRHTRTAANVQHVDHPWFSATPDRFAPAITRSDGGEAPPALVEIKVVRTWVLDRLLAAGLPEPAHVQQVHMQMLVTGTHMTHLFYWSPESMKTCLFPVEFDEDESIRLMDLTVRFWEDNFQGRVRPAASDYVEPPESLSSAMVKLNDASLEAKCVVYQRMQAGTKAAGAVTKDIKKMILDEVQANASTKLAVGGYTISAPWVAPKKLDNGALDAFLMEHGKRLDDFKVPGAGYHRMTITGEPSAAIAELTDAQLNQLVEATEERNDGEDN